MQTHVSRLDPEIILNYSEVLEKYPEAEFVRNEYGQVCFLAETLTQWLGQRIGKVSLEDVYEAVLNKELTIEEVELLLIRTGVSLDSFVSFVKTINRSQ